MICTEEQRNVLEELFVEVLLCMVNQRSVNPIAVWKTCHFKAAKSWLFGGILCLQQYNCMRKSSNDFTSATERVTDEPRLFNAFNTSFGTVTKTSQDEYFE